MVYLASPYSHLDPKVRESRFDAACRMAADLMRRGVAVFSPIVHSHPLAAYGLPTDWGYWERYDCEHLERCDVLAVLMLPGWRESVGVAKEIEIAGRLRKPVSFLEP